MNLNVETWKEFKVGSLFDIELAKGDIKFGDVVLGDVPLISSGEDNNGIVGYIDKGGDGVSKIFRRNCLTVDMFGNSFYQDEDFFAVSHGRVNILKPKFDLTLCVGLFISTIINKEKFKYSYGRAVYSNVIKESYVRLPIKYNADGTPFIDINEQYSSDGYIPDWQFMEDYIKSLHHKPLTTSNNNPGGGCHLLHLVLMNGRNLD